MEVQSLSILIPAGCPNRCPFCVSHMNKENKKFRTNVNIDLDSVKRRMEFARDNGTNTLMITSTGEALENMDYVIHILDINKRLPSPFKWIELQTSGVGLMDCINEYGYSMNKINTISISVVDIFSSEYNSKWMKMPAGREVDLDELVKFLKERNFNVRISINLTNIYNNIAVEDLYQRLGELDVDQVTFRKLYLNGNGSKQDNWIEKNKLDYETFNDIIEYVEDNGNALELLPFGAMKYSLNGISTVIDDDCMSKEVRNVLKYLIIRENGKLYSRWDDKGSLIF